MSAVFRRLDRMPVDWRVSDWPVPVVDVEREMDARVATIRAGQGRELVWLCEHPATITAGMNAQPEGLVDKSAAVINVRRGGAHTWHGPGQRVICLMLDLRTRKPDVRGFIGAVEDWLIAALLDLEVFAEQLEGKPGVWVEREDDYLNIAALGFRVRRFVTSGCVALNVDPDLKAFDAIHPCGIADTDFGVTSIAALGGKATMGAADAALRRNFEKHFGPTRTEAT